MRKRERATAAGDRKRGTCGTLEGTRVDGTRGGERKRDGETRAVKMNR